MVDEHDRDLQPTPDEQASAERVDRYLDALLEGGRPSPDDAANRDEAEMARLAAEIAAAGDPAGGVPDTAFVDQLRRRMSAADRGIAAIRVPPPVISDVGDPSRVRLTRRQLLTGGLIGAAGLAAGAVGATLLRPAESGSGPGIWDDGTDLIGSDGTWLAVATVDEVPPGTAVRFSTPAFDGYVVNDAGEIRALSSVCTHMGCTLQYREAWQDLRCPCHGASFDLNGELANGRSRWRVTGGYRGDERAYPIELPPLIRPAVKVADGQVLVWTTSA